MIAIGIFIFVLIFIVLAKKFSSGPRYQEDIGRDEP